MDKVDATYQYLNKRVQKNSAFFGVAFWTDSRTTPAIPLGADCMHQSFTRLGGPTSRGAKTLDPVPQCGGETLAQHQAKPGNHGVGVLLLFGWSGARWDDAEAPLEQGDPQGW